MDFDVEFPELQGESCKSILAKVYAQNASLIEVSDRRKLWLQISNGLLLLLLVTQAIIFILVYNIYTI